MSLQPVHNSAHSLNKDRSGTDTSGVSSNPRPAVAPALMRSDTQQNCDAAKND